VSSQASLVGAKLGGLQEKSVGSQERVWLGLDGKALPFKTDEEVKDFLRTAEVVSSETIQRGITKPSKILLKKDGVEMHATFRDVDLFEAEWRGAKGTVRKNFRDSCLFECAAYELSLLLGLDTVPPVIVREINGKQGTLQIWLENAITEQMRKDHEIDPPSPWRWNMQHAVMAIFDNLIFNDDRNQGNIIIDPEWKIWWIDHTRAFRAFNQLSRPEKIEFIEIGLWENLLSLDEDEIEERLKDYIRPTEISTLLERRKGIIDRIEELIKEKGEKKVLFKF
jgi:hypothetical protein